VLSRGFILQTSYRVQTRPDGVRVPVVHIYGRLEDGGTFLVRDDRQRPYFFIRKADLERAQTLRIPAAIECDHRTFDGEPVVRIEAGEPGDVPAIRDRLQAAGIETFEADVRFAVRYLIERGIKGGCEIEGEPSQGRGGMLVFDNPVLRAAIVKVEPRVFAFDIETDGDKLLAISMFAPGLDEVLIVDPQERPMPEHAIRCENATFDPDVITGWNTIDFDFTMLQKIAARVRHPFELGRDSGSIRIRKPEGYFGSGQATIPGRLVLDGIDLLRGAFVRMEDYSLDAVARHVLGEGKAVHGNVRDRLGEILHNYANDLPAFALYARTDARLAYRIVEKLDLVRLAFARSELAGMTPDRVAASIASFDFVYLTELGRRRIAAPTVRGDDSRVHAAQHGGHVLEPVAGLHRNVWVFDFKSLYPSIIRTFNIDPLSYVAEPREVEDLIVTPGGRFRREPAILPRLLDDLFPRREAAKQAHDDVASNAIKILMNSFYGVLGTSACRFYNPALTNSITGMGRELLLWSKRWFEDCGFAVLYGDTDSLFVRSDIEDAEQAALTGRELANHLSQEIAAYIQQRWRLTSKLELKYEKLYLRLFLSRARHSTRGASKRYAGLRQTPDGNRKVEFVGMEVVRSDWTALAKQVQRELYERLFADQAVDRYLEDIVKKVRSGALDDLLVYRKNLRKGAEEYTATTPPHVAAARKSNEATGRSISYVMTTNGPEPIDNVRSPLDREHYVVKQIKPVAEPVLDTLGLQFERVIGDVRQMDLLL
jgi:DNA polymerase-2